MSEMINQSFLWNTWSNGQSVALKLISDTEGFGKLISGTDGLVNQIWSPYNLKVQCVSHAFEAVPIKHIILTKNILSCKRI